MSSGDMEASGPPTSRKQKSLGFGNWLRKGNSRATDDSSKKLESPAEEIKQVFLRQLELSSIELDGTYYHSVFTGAQIVDIIYRHFGLPDRTLASKVASRLIDCSLYTHVSGESQGVVDSNSEMYTLTEEAHMALKALRKSDSTDTDVDVDADERQQQRGKTQAWGVLKAGWAVPGRLDVAAARRMAAVEKSDSPAETVVEKPELAGEGELLDGVLSTWSFLGEKVDESTGPRVSQDLEAAEWQRRPRQRRWAMYSGKSASPAGVGTEHSAGVGTEHSAGVDTEHTEDDANTVDVMEGRSSSVRSSVGRASDVRSSVGRASDVRSSDASSLADMLPQKLALWRDTVPGAVLGALTEAQVAQQEAMHELAATEAAFAGDLELIDAAFGAALGRELGAEAGEALLRAVFFNYRDLIGGARRLLAALHAQQAADGVWGGVGGVVDAWADDVGALVECAVHVAAGQGALEAAVAGSARVAAAVAAGEAAARRLPVQSFVGRAAARLARYPLLLDAIARRGVGDAAAVLRAAAKVRAALREVDARTGAEAAGHRLRLISARLVLAPAARASLRLDSAARRLEMEGELRDAAGARVRVFLFDNALVVARERRVAHARSVPVYDAADAIVPVALLAAHAPRAAGLARRLPARRDAPAVVFAHIARGWRHALVAACARDRDRWLAAVARAAARPHTRVAALACVRVVTDVAPRAPVCAAAEGALALVGARDGLHAAVAAGGAAPRFVRVAAPGAVARVLVLAAQRVAVVLADGALHAYALDAIEAAAAHGAPLPPAQAASSVALVAAAPAHALVVLAKTRGARSVVKCLHASRDAPFLAPPAAHFSVPGRARHVLFLRRKLCVAAGARFHVADVASARVLRVLPDPQDDDFAFLDAEGPALVALASCKVGREFLLCYDAVAFFIDNFGRRARPHVLVRWEAPPTCLTFRPPYVVAFNPAFIEVRHIHDGALLSIIRLPSAVCLDPDSTATTLRVAIGPGPVGFPAPQPCGPDDSAATFQPPRPVSTAESSASASSSTSTSTSSSSPSSSSSPASSSPSSAASAIPTPVTTAADPPPVQGYVVPGLAGPDGDRLFPASHSPNHYRIIEIHLPSTLEPSKPPQ